MTYRKFSIKTDAALAHNYLANMVDGSRDYLPYWLIGANENPAWAQHCRVDDAELVASWYEALACVMEILNTDDGADVLAGFKRHLMRSWGEHGLRFHEKYPWTHTMHSSFHEMGYVMSALVRLCALEPDNKEAESRLRDLIKGLRGLVIELKTITFWAGDFPFTEPIYKFPNDVYIKDKGWDFSCVTGRGEKSIRNGVILHPLVQAYDLMGDESALDLAVGTANYLLGQSRYFNWKREFFGHVHSAVWFAGGLARLGVITGDDHYIKCAKQIFDYVLGISSSYGWVPEYAQWHPMDEEHCETCCIKDMIFAGFELIDAGFSEYWDVINRFTRNHLTEQQIKTGEFVGVDNSLEDTADMTFKNIDKRVVGGYSGGSLPNSISLKKFRSVAGCCIGTAPQALHLVWRNIVRDKNGTIEINLPLDCDGAATKIATDYPNQDGMKITAKRGGDYSIRIHPFMKTGLHLSLDGKPAPLDINNDMATVKGVSPGSTIMLEHDLVEESRAECFAGGEYDVRWRGADVIGIDPPGEPLRLYQRNAEIEPKIPGPPPRMDGIPKGFDARPTQQKK